MLPETMTALRNYDWLIRRHGLDDVELDWESDTLIYGNGGTTLDTLTEPGFTPATYGVPNTVRPPAVEPEPSRIEREWRLALLGEQLADAAAQAAVAMPEADRLWFLAQVRAATNAAREAGPAV